MTEAIQYRTDEKGYGEIRLNRPEKHNAISKEMTNAWKLALETAKQQPIKFLVITGAGDRTFCAGGDLHDLHGEMSPDEAFSLLYPMKEVLYEIASFPVPVICIMNGDAVGGGCEIATACDFRISREETAFGFVQTTLGITPGWGGGVLLYEKVHPSFAFHWIVEGARHRADELREQGWVHRIVSENEWQDLDQVLKPYLSKSEAQMRTLKAQYKKKLSILPLSAQMDDEVRNCAKLWDSPEHKEAVGRFLSRG
ncbi:enoyl-CoA hydratase/isomerase family protein [Lentibacillus lipolyticus]|nr:enoyl-CoA hydratase/isomerase family protein [Lentibacillus lipolyticus]